MLAFVSLVLSLHSQNKFFFLLLKLNRTRSSIIILEADLGQNVTLKTRVLEFTFICQDMIFFLIFNLGKYLAYNT